MGKEVLQVRSWSTLLPLVTGYLFPCGVPVLEHDPSGWNRPLDRSEIQAGQGQAPGNAPLKENYWGAVESNTTPGVNDKKSSSLRHLARHTGGSGGLCRLHLEWTWSVYRWEGWGLCVNSHEGTETKQRHPRTECHQATEQESTGLRPCKTRIPGRVDSIAIADWAYSQIPGAPEQEVVI